MNIDISIKDNKYIISRKNLKYECESKNALINTIKDIINEYTEKNELTTTYEPEAGDIVKYTYKDHTIISIYKDDQSNSCEGSYICVFYDNNNKSIITCSYLNKTYYKREKANDEEVNEFKSYLKENGYDIIKTIITD